MWVVWSGLWVVGVGFSAIDDALTVWTHWDAALPADLSERESAEIGLMLSSFLIVIPPVGLLILGAGWFLLAAGFRARKDGS